MRYLRTIADSPVGGDTSLNADYFDIVDQYLPIVIGDRARCCRSSCC